MDLRLILAILVGKTVAKINNITGSGGTAAPGLYALKVDPNLVKKLTGKISGGNILISGTNGKTTTARLTSDILSQKYKVIHNRQGSNLLRGIASTLIANCTKTGKVDADLALWEVDEAAFPQAVKNTAPKFITLINLFRDQLDRYGEIDTIKEKWQKVFNHLGKNTTLILNADDPSMVSLSKNFAGKVVFFGVEDTKFNLPKLEQVSDVKNCPRCNHLLKYSVSIASHMGHYTCTNCSFKRPKPNFFANNLKFNNLLSTSFNLSTSANHQLPTTNYPLTYSLPGLYNVYNVLAASTISLSFEKDVKNLSQIVANFSPAFGRFQQAKVGGKTIIIALVKNPTGANEVLRTLAQTKNLNMLALLNDKIADGRDVSWVWDTSWEVLKSKVKNITIGGTRCWDLATRLKYANFKLSKENVSENIQYSIEKALKNTNNNNTLIILPTYTAMLEVQNYLSKELKKKWHND